MRGYNKASSALFLLTASTLALSVATVVPAWAQTWSGAVDSDWYTAGNWSTATVPTSASVAIISGPTVNTPTINGGVAAANLVLLGHATAGTAKLDLTNHASLTTTNAIIGDGTNANPNVAQYHSGAVTLDGASTWSVDSLTIGAYGDGTLDIQGGSQVTASTLMMGSNRGPASPEFSSGIVEISGNGSKLTVTSTSTTIGNDGSGSVLIEDQGSLITRSAGLGLGALSSGEVTVTGSGSAWTVTGNGAVNVGQLGTGTLKIQNGGSFSNGTGRLNIVGASSSTGTGSLLVEGTGSTLQAGQLWIGSGTGTAEIRAGATANVTAIFLGTSAAGGSGTLSISGANTLVNSSGAVLAGYLKLGTITLYDDATLRTPTLTIASASGSTGIVNIGGAAGHAAAAPGTVDTTSITFGSGTGTLVFNHTGTNYSVASNISGTGTIRHISGVTSLTGNGGGFAGTTNLEGGTLKVLGTLGGNMVVGSGAILGGNGTVGVTTLNSGSTVAPDGTLNVSGSLTFASGSTYKADVGSGTSDNIQATGTVTINGGTVDLQTSGKSFSRQESYKILGGNVITGSFSNLNTQSAFLDALLDYSHAGEVRVNLSRNDMAFADVASTGNQQVIANILGALPSNHPLVAAMLGLSAAQAQDALNQLSGDTQATLETAGASIAGQVQNVLMNRIRQAFSAIGAQGGSVSSYAPRVGEVDAGEQPDISYWLQGLGEYAHVDATTTSGGLRSGTAGILGGADVALNEWRLGVVGGYTGTGYTAEGRPADGSINNIHAGLYAGAEFDALRLQLNALQTWHGISSRRNVSFGGLNETLTADYGAQTSLLFGEVGYGFDLGAVELEPFGSIAYSLGQTNAYSESGGASALTVAASTQQSVTTVLGLRPEMAFAVDDKLLTVRGMLGWQHQAGETPAGNYSLAGSAPFTVTGSSLSSHALVYEAGLNLDVNEGLNLDLLYSGRLAPNDFAQGIKGIVAAKF